MVVLYGCSGPAVEENANSYAVPVAVTEAKVTDLVWTRSYSGSLAGIRQAEPTAKIPETVVALRATEGDKVRAGDVLIVFDMYGPTSQVRQVEAAYLDAKRNFEKYQRLFEGGAVSEQERDITETQHKITLANYEAARDQVQIKSPINGILTDIQVKIGQQAMAGQTLAVIAAVDTMRLTLEIPYFDARPMARGAAVNIRSELDTTITGAGWIQKISESANPVTRTVAVDVLIPNPDGLLRPGMYVTGEVVLGRLEQVVTVPVDALVDRGAVRGVFVAVDSLAHFVSVVEGLTVEETTEIKSGLSAGDRVVIFGQQSLQDRTRISIESIE
jgi:membrane fusion protein (multidrug efflux system)